MPTPSRSALVRALALPAAAACVLSGVLVAAPAHATDESSPLPIVKPSWATPRADAGRAAATDAVEFELPLDLQDESAAEAFALAVATPGSAQYHRFLSPADWIARFAPTQATFDAAAAALASEGMTVSATQPASREYVVATGTAAQISAAFRTSLHRYRVNGATRFAAASGVTLPKSLVHRASAPLFGGTTMHSMIAAPAKTASTGTCSAYWNQHRVSIPKTQKHRTTSTMLCGYGAKQLRAIYGLDAKGRTHDRGAGQTIAVIDAFGSATMKQDLATYSSRNGLPKADYREVVPAASTWQETEGCAAADWLPEQSLDLEAAHAVAPAAKLVYVGATDCAAGIDLAMSTVLDQGLASIVSNSYDTVEEPVSPDLQVHQHLQAAGEGIGLYYASGDTGDNSDVSSTFEPTVGFPSSSPWVTAVGGTTVALDKHRKTVFTTAWGDDLNGVRDHASSWLLKLPGVFSDSGAGGGSSDLFARPAYQRGVVPTSLSDGSRATTDVSALADPYTGFTVGFRKHAWSSYKTVSYGGTSLATPIVAAEAAIAQQQAGHALGWMNPLAYRLHAKFADVRPSKTHRIAYVEHLNGLRLFVVFGHDSSLAARKGYDLPTGLGQATAATLTALARG